MLRTKVGFSLPAAENNLQSRIHIRIFLTIINFVVRAFTNHAPIISNFYDSTSLLLAVLILKSSLIISGICPSLCFASEKSCQMTFWGTSESVLNQVILHFVEQLWIERKHYRTKHQATHLDFFVDGKKYEQKYFWKINILRWKTSGSS